jgi:hypothetical protein
MNAAIRILACGLFVSSALWAQKPQSLADTLDWLHGASEQESSDGETHITFESKGGCSVVIRETRSNAREFWETLSFSLSDIDPADIQTEVLDAHWVGPGHAAVTFHTRNYTDKIRWADFGNPEGRDVEGRPETTSTYILETNPWFAPRFAAALKRGAELCGAKPSSF